eukprot:3482587-Rhodomonas_salina.1
MLLPTRTVLPTCPYCASTCPYCSTHVLVLCFGLPVLFYPRARTVLRLVRTVLSTCTYCASAYACCSTYVPVLCFGLPALFYPRARTVSVLRCASSYPYSSTHGSKRNGTECNKRVSMIDGRASMYGDGGWSVVGGPA